ncbi:MAG TPA: divergent polysaccharide deacetylase family protein, partial [Gammaproteobacteria bacterium]|nr:divergent polysaccharide deacetylase family protein [Gammaproteobacteria bacterium]
MAAGRTPLAALAGALLLWAAGAAAASPPAVAIIIDDLGDRLDAGERALALPGPLTYSFLPHTPYSARLARRAHALGKEVMLHLPMEAVAGNRLGPGAVTLHMNQAQLLRTVRSDLAAVPHVRGINNHMGSL